MTQNSNRNISTTVSYTVNQGSVQAVQAANGAVAASFANAGAAVAAMSPAVLALNPQLMQLAQQTATATAGMNAYGASVKSVIRDIGDLGRDSERLPFPDMGALPGERAGRSASGALQSAAYAGIALPGVGFQNPIVMGLRVASAAAEATGASFLQVGAAGALLVPAMIGLGMAFAEFTKGIQAAKVALGGALAAQQNYYNAVAEMTTQQVREEIAKRQIVLDLQKQQAAELQSALERAFAQSQAAFGDAGARILDAGKQSAGSQLQEQFDALNKSMTENEGTIARYTQGIDANAFAANDAADALDKLEEAQKKFADAVRSSLNEEADIRVHAAELRRSGTEEQVRDELQANRDRISIIDNFLIPAYQREGLETEALSEEAANLTKANRLLLESVLPIVMAREREAAAAKQFEDAFSEAWDNLGEAQRRAGEAAEKVREAMEDLTEAENEHKDKLAEIAAEGEEKRRKIIEEADKQAEDALEKHNQRVAEIELQYSRDAEAAIGNRDALALYRAQQKRSDDLTKEDANYTEQQKKLKAHLEEQLAQQDEAQRKAIQSENESWNKRQRQLQKALSDAQAEEWKAQQLALGYQKRANELQLAEQQRLHGDLQASQNNANAIAANTQITHQQTLAQIAQSGSVAVENAFQTMMNNLVAIVNGSTGGSGGGGGGGGGGIGPGLMTSASFDRQWDRRNLEFQRRVNR